MIRRCRTAIVRGRLERRASDDREILDGELLTSLDEGMPAGEGVEKRHGALWPFDNRRREVVGLVLPRALAPERDRPTQAGEHLRKGRDPEHDRLGVGVSLPGHAADAAGVSPEVVEEVGDGIAAEANPLAVGTSAGGAVDELGIRLFLVRHLDEEEPRAELPHRLPHVVGIGVVQPIQAKM